MKITNNGMIWIVLTFQLLAMTILYEKIELTSVRCEEHKFDMVRRVVFFNNQLLNDLSIIEARIGRSISAIIKDYPYLKLERRSHEN